MNDISYTQWRAMSDDALMKTIGEFIQHNRLQQNRTQDQVAADAGISRSTLSLLERGESVRLDTLIKVLRVLDLLYVIDQFRIQQQISPLEYAKLKRKERKQASPGKKPKKEEPGW